MTKIYGIKNCDTMKKAFKWLENADISYEYHDYRKNGIDKTLLLAFIKEFGWESLINKRGTTYRTLSQEEKNTLNEQNAIELMLEKPAIIKRPVLIHNDQYLLGFSADQYQALLLKENA